jgi:hypothetical protein
VTDDEWMRGVWRRIRREEPWWRRLLLWFRRLTGWP